MKVAKAIGAAIIAIATVLGGVGSFAQWAGIEFNGAVGAAIDAAPAWLPAASLLLGVLIGWNAKKWMANRDGRQSKRRIEKTIWSLNDREKDMLLTAYLEKGVFDTPEKTKAEPLPEETLLSLRNRGLVSRVTCSDSIFVKSTWSISEAAKKVIDKDEALHFELDDAFDRLYPPKEDDRIDVLDDDVLGVIGGHCIVTGKYLSNE